MSYLPTTISLPLSENELREIIPKAKDWAMMHGASIRQKTNYSDDFLHVSMLRDKITITKFSRISIEVIVVCWIIVMAFVWMTINSVQIYYVYASNEFEKNTLLLGSEFDADRE